MEKKKSSDSRIHMRTISMIPPPTPSQPVVIPTRVRTVGPRRKKEKHLEKDNTPALDGRQHDPRSIPPSVAALLAITAIPGRRRARRPKQRPCEVLPEPAGSLKRGKGSGPASSDPNQGSWGILLSPPCDTDSDDMSLKSDTTVGPPSSISSVSSEVMPSLDAKSHAWGSASSPSPPGMAMTKRSGGERRPRASRSTSQDCVSDHPLLPGPVVPDPDPGPGLDHVLPIHTRPRGSAKSTFKSNLTASLRTLKSAAVSFSTLTAPLAQRDDDLARAVLSISLPFTDERRPSSCGSLPDPALRRYLNPVSRSPAELYFHRHPSPRSTCTASIQLRTVRKNGRNPAQATAPLVFAAHPSSAPRADQSVGAAPRPREPRENSDFLRVIVLEMNMRRAGKLRPAAPGRARLWLPARPAATPPDVEDGAIPKRWMDQVP